QVSVPRPPSDGIECEVGRAIGEVDPEGYDYESAKDQRNQGYTRAIHLSLSMRSLGSNPPGSIPETTGLTPAALTTVDIHCSPNQVRSGVYHGHQDLPKSRSTTQQPLTCSPPSRQCRRMSGSVQPASSSASAITGMSAKSRVSYIRRAIDT